LIGSGEDQDSQTFEEEKDQGRFPFDQKFRCEFPEISMGEWYRLFQYGIRQAAQFRSLGIFQ